MTAFQQVERLLPEMTRSEKAQLIKWAIGVPEYGFPGVESTPGVCGGSVCIVRTRISVWSLVAYKNIGVSDETLLENFPTLRKADLINAWNYYAINQAEIDQEIRENDEA